MTAGGLLAGVSSAELTQWVAFYQVEAEERQRLEAEQRAQAGG